MPFVSMLSWLPIQGQVHGMIPICWLDHRQRQPATWALVVVEPVSMFFTQACVADPKFDIKTLYSIFACWNVHCCWLIAGGWSTEHCGFFWSKLTSHVSQSSMYKVIQGRDFQFFMKRIHWLLVRTAKKHEQALAVPGSWEFYNPTVWLILTRWWFKIFCWNFDPGVSWSNLTSICFKIVSNGLVQPPTRDRTSFP